MNKTFVTGSVLLVLGALAGVALFQVLAPRANVGIPINEASYGNTQVTVSSVECPIATSTLVVGQQPGRTSFIASNNATATVFLCKSTDTCTATNGIRLTPTSTSLFVQNDGFFGSYRCISSVGTGTLGIQYSR